MALPKKGKKRALEDEVFTSKPVKKQQKFPARRKSVKIAAELETAEPPRKRSKKRSTLTQLDFGRRSFFDIIGASDSEGKLSENEAEVPVSTAKPKKAPKAKKSKLPEKTESQGTLTQPAFSRRRINGAVRDSDDDEEIELKSESDIASTAKSKTKKTESRRRNKLPPKTDSQDTMTQFVKRSSDVSMMIVDSEDDGAFSEVEAPNPRTERETSVELGDEQAAVKNETQVMQMNDVPAAEVSRNTADGAERDVHPTTDQEDLPDADQEGISQAHAVASRQPRTPKRKRILPVPSSQSPPDSHISTQETPESRKRQRRVQASPSKSKPVPVLEARITRSARKKTPKIARVTSCIAESPLKRSPLKEKSANVPAPPRLRSAMKRSAQLSPEKPLETQSSPMQNAPSIDSPTKRRVRDFNARFALLEQANADLRSRRSRGPAFPSTISRSKSDLPVINAKVAASKETQYSLGTETQAEWFLLDVDKAIGQAEADEGREGSPEVVVSSHPPDVAKEDDPEAIQSTSAQPKSQDHAEEVVQNGDGVVIHNDVTVEEVIIPSSQSKRSSRIAFEDLTVTPTSSAKAPEEGAMMLEESLPESPYPSASAMSATSKRDTQDLASDQLMRETQQAWNHRMPSSLELMPAPVSASRQHPSSQHQPAIRPSQATTVDETMTYSSRSLRSQLPLGTFPAEPQLKSQHSIEQPDDISSTPVEEPFIPAITHIVLSSSPILRPPGLSEVSSSSPRLPEPKTPKVLRNLQQPLRLEELITESLDMSIPAPPTWRYGDGFEEESDDGEL